MPDYEAIINPFIDDLDKMQAQLIKKIELALKQGLTGVGLAQLNAELDLFEELNKLGYSARVEKFMDSYADIIDDIHKKAIKSGLAGIVGVTLENLEVLASNEAIFLLDKGRAYTSQFKNALFSSLIAGQPPGEVLVQLNNLPFTDAQLNTAINTGITRFRSVATAKVYDEDPSQRFVLEGPVDSKTRDTCKAVMLNQPDEGFTKDEIDSGAWSDIAGDTYTFIERGGYNCRHDVFPV